MSEITEKQIEQVYVLAKEVYAGTKDRGAVLAELQTLGMNITSAKYYLNNFQRMMNGRIYTLTMNAYATKYFLDGIRKDYGDQHFEKALTSVRLHLNYYSKHSKQEKIREAISSYSNEFPEIPIAVPLENLNESGHLARIKYLEEFKWKDTPLSDDFIRLFQSKSSELAEKCELGRYSGRLTRSFRGEYKTIDFSYQSLVMASYFVDYAILARRYYDLVMNLFSTLTARSGGLIENNSSGKDRFFDTLKGSGENWQEKISASYSPDFLGTFKSVLAEFFPSAIEHDYIIKYICVDGWSHSGKELKRTDYPESGILSVAGVVQADQGVLDDFVLFLANNPEILQTLYAEMEALSIGSEIMRPILSVPNTDLGKNQIVYGAPGAGKSYYLDNVVRGQTAIRTVFHPEYQHSDFVGGVKPAMKDDGITYEYVPGPFILALLDAVKNKDKHVFLIIEEINRASAAAVFGDIFQLLDRRPDGQSQYTITTDMSLRGFLKSQGIEKPEQIFIPSNLSILATMNSSDQGVFMLDAAFKRRWQFHYCPIIFSETSSEISSVVPYAGKSYTWKTFAETINSALKAERVEEDRLIGPYFLSDHERVTVSSCKDAVAGKLLIYLWDDVLRHGLRDKIFSPDFRTYSDLVSAYRDGKSIFIPATDKKLSGQEIPAVDEVSADNVSSQMHEEKVA